MIYADEAAMMLEYLGKEWPAELFNVHEICEQIRVQESVEGGGAYRRPPMLALAAFRKLEADAAGVFNNAFLTSKIDSSG